MVSVRFKPDPDKKYIAFNKPFGVLCQFTRPDGSDKETLADFDFPKNVYSIGRLDADSEGLLILTDDPRLNGELLSSSHAHQRTYYVCVEHNPSADQLQKLQKGVIIEGKKTLPAKARLLNEIPNLPPRPVPIRIRKYITITWIELSLTEGRNRQVRKMTAAIGCPTLRLVRVAISKLNLFELALHPGQWRILTKDELLRLCSR